MPHACCSPVFLLLKQPQAEAAEVPFPCIAPSALHPSATRHRPAWQVSSEQLQLLWWTGCPPQLLGIPPAFLPGTSGVDLPLLKSTFYMVQTVENCSWENKGCYYPWKHWTYRTKNTGPLTLSPEQLHISHSVGTDTGADVVFDVLPSSARFYEEPRS